MQEIWKPILGYEHLYEVSNMGRIKSLKKYHGTALYNDTILKCSFDKDGYVVVCLRNNGVLKTAKVHRLVAEAFLSNPCGKPQVNHSDGNKSNNSVDNLEWSTCAENIIHAVKTGLRDFHYQSEPVLLVNEQTGEKHTFKSLKDASEFLGHARQYLTKIRKKKGNREFSVGGYLVRT